MILAVFNPDDLPLRDRSFVVALVVLAHVLILWPYVLMPGQTKPAHREMSISMSLPGLPQISAVEQKQVVKPRVIQSQPVQKVAAPEIPSDKPVDRPAEAPASSLPMESGSAQPVESISTQTENASPGLPDREPDYHAAYLNNPLPAYPMVARRMGWQGKVVLNVEVLESGLPGQIKLHQSSGRDVLDNTAMQAVRGWKFVAARQNGQVVSKWFLVPIPFKLKDAE